PGVIVTFPPPPPQRRSLSSHPVAYHLRAVVESALLKNCKSYGAWYHRKWVVSKGNISTKPELQLLRKFQLLDTRNFHAWDYRRFIAGLMNIPDEQELKMTRDTIESTDLAKITMKWSKPDKIEHEIVKNTQKLKPETFSVY
nr:geranylgeranyl transferase type-2 subunit alpha 1 [Tanacetum cinerariifolium]